MSLSDNSRALCLSFSPSPTSTVEGSGMTAIARSAGKSIRLRFKKNPVMEEKRMKPMVGKSVIVTGAAAD